MADRLFKNASVEQEIATSMEKQLVSNQVENQFSFDKITKAADFLFAAAEIFDDTGFYAEAEALTVMLEKLADRNKTAGQMGDLTPEEIKFYQELPAHTRHSLQPLIKKKHKHTDVSDFVDEVKLLYALHKDKEPISMRSLTQPSAPMAPDFGEELIEFKSTASKKKV